jgi:hypothetical protein
VSTLPPGGFYLANPSGTVTGTHVAAASRLAPLRNLASAARAQWYWVVVAGALAATIVALERWDDGEVKKALQDWSDAAKFLSGDQFGASLAAAMPKDEDWTFDDRDAFDASMLKLTQEVDALLKALEANKEALAQVAEKYRDTIDGLVDAMVPILVAVIASIVLQAWPHTNPIAVAIGVAGATATVFILTEVWNNLGTLFSTGAAFFRNSSAAEFVMESRPGWADPDKPDPNIRDIVINYNLDPSAYKKP